MDKRATAYREASDLCARLRERGDPLSLDAAATIEGTLDAFAGVVEAKREAEERHANTERNLRCLDALWARVPSEHRHRAAHGIKVEG